MKAFCLLDLTTQSILIVFWGIIAMNDGFKNELVFGGYFIVGFIQIVSAAVHYISRPFVETQRERKSYRMLVLGLGIVYFIMLLLGIAGLTVALYYFVFLLFISPVIALWYWSICFRELMLPMNVNNGI